MSSITQGYRIKLIDPKVKAQFLKVHGRPEAKINMAANDLNVFNDKYKGKPRLEVI